MGRKLFTGLGSDAYEHPFDQKALVSLEKMPGVSLLFRKINENGIDRLLRLQSHGNSIRVSHRNFPKLHQALVETCQILDVSPVPELHLMRGTGHIKTLTIGVEQPIVMINFDGMEELSSDELLFVLGHEVAHIKSNHLLYHQTATILPALKNILSSTTMGLGGLATNGIEMALYNWLMMARFTSDRAGLLACQNVEIATTALLKIGGLPSKYLTPAVVEDFVAQAREFEDNSLKKLDQLTKLLSFMEQLYPWAVMRASELFKWVDSGDYQELIAEIPSISENQEKAGAGEWDFLTSWN